MNRAFMAAAALLGALGGWTQESEKGKAEHVILTPDDVKWTDGPATLPPGAKAAVIDGDPKKEGFFALRLKLPAGYKVPPHWHPGDERLTVISGAFHVGLGETFDETKTRKLPAGGYFSFPPKTAHFAYCSEETVVQVNTIGPWSIHYVHPEDDPRNKKPK